MTIAFIVGMVFAYILQWVARSRELGRKKTSQ